MQILSFEFKNDINLIYSLQGFVYSISYFERLIRKECKVGAHLLRIIYCILLRSITDFLCHTCRH